MCTLDLIIPHILCLKTGTPRNTHARISLLHATCHSALYVNTNSIFFFLNGKNQFKPTQCISYIRAEYTNYWRHPCGQIYPSLWTLSIFLWFGFFSFHTEISKQTKNAPVTFIFIWVTFIFRAQLKYSTINKI